MRGGRGGGGRRKGKDRGDKRARARGLNGGRGTCVLTEREEKKTVGKRKKDTAEKTGEKKRKNDVDRRKSSAKSSLTKTKHSKKAGEGGAKEGTRAAGMEG